MSHHSGTPRQQASPDYAVHFDFDEVRKQVEALLNDPDRLSLMSPLEHFQWARTLPACTGDSQLPSLLARAAQQVAALGTLHLQEYRSQSWEYWLERKRVLDPIWACAWEALPSHVRAVLGPKKNILLLRELLVAAGCPDKALIDDLTIGFPLLGELPRSGSLPACAYVETEETRESLLRCAAERNSDMSDSI